MALSRQMTWLLALLVLTLTTLAVVHLSTVAVFVKLPAIAKKLSQQSSSTRAATCFTTVYNGQQTNTYLLLEQSGNDPVQVTGYVIGDPVTPGSSVELRLLDSSAAFCRADPFTALSLTPSTPANNQVSFSGSLPGQFSLTEDSTNGVIDRLVAAVVTSGQTQTVFCCNIELITSGTTRALQLFHSLPYTH